MKVIAEEKKLSLDERLANVQAALKAPKGQYNSHGKYKYRSCEDILEAVKPLLRESGLTLRIEDEIIERGHRFYVRATATLICPESGESLQTNGFAREQEELKGMTAAQITGAASSYARKYALNGLFLIDDTADDDARPPVNQAPANGQFTAHCRSCGARYTFQSPEQMAQVRCCPSPNYEVE